MIAPVVIEFLYELKLNNNRDWFQANKERYTEARKNVEQFVEDLISTISQFDPNIAELKPKECMFRIYRDVRFSKDKSPYKTNFGGFITPGGRKSGKAGYYLHIEPEESFLAGGIYMPPPPMLKAVRNEIYYNSREFTKIIQNKNFVNHFGEIRGDKLARPPKDFPKDFEEIELLKYKSYTVMHSVDKEIMMSENFFNYASEVFRSMYDFNAFLNRGFENQE